MAEQTTFASLAWQTKGKVTRREQFLAEMNAVIPWQRLIAIFEPYYPKAGNGRRPLGLEKMLRVHFLQQRFNLSDPGAEDAIYDSESMRRFVGIELGVDTIPDESTILNFRRLIERHDLGAAIFMEIGSLLEEKGLLLKKGTIVDATIISAPSSTKNRTRTRDPEMRQTRKGKTWYHGMKVHVGTDIRGLVHSLTTTDAAQADIKEMPKLLHGDETEVYGDRAYWSEADRQECRRSGIRYRVNRRGHRSAPVSEYWRKINRSRSRVRARCEHNFLVWKRHWGFAKTRYRGLAKNTTRVYTCVALANLYLVRRDLLPPGAKCAL
jgi:IS5 family transposase